MHRLGDFTAIATVGAISIDGIGIPTGLADLSVGGLLITLVAFLIISIVRGWLVVKMHYDAALKRAETAETALAKVNEVNAVQARTIEKQTAVGETVVKVMNSVQEARAAGEAAP
ncbi:membrane protein [Arthrobacter phage BruhMoment]|nr:membrane protein [Arthrobacter phage BruhMoment]